MATKKVIKALVKKMSGPNKGKSYYRYFKAESGHKLHKKETLERLKGIGKAESGRAAELEKLKKAYIRPRQAVNKHLPENVVGLKPGQVGKKTSYDWNGRPFEAIPVKTGKGSVAMKDLNSMLKKVNDAGGNATNTVFEPKLKTAYILWSKGKKVASKDLIKKALK